MKSPRHLSPEQAEVLFSQLKTRFEKHPKRHSGIVWKKVQVRLEANPEKLWSLNEMEKTGGEPDVLDYDEKTGVLTFYDCSAESPRGRRSLCYDKEALRSRKENKPTNSATEMASEMGMELLTEDQYRHLQEYGPFDTKTSSWLKTPEGVRTLGGAIFGDYRFGRVFIYHNGADSYYASRGFRGLLRI